MEVLNKILNKKQENDIYEFHPLNVEIEDRPINPLGRVILWLVVAVIFIGCLWLFFAKIDVVVSARGKVIPSGEVKILQPIETGVISKILIKEGDYVKKGQVLMQIDPSVTETSLEAKQKDLEVIRFQLQRIDALINNNPLKVTSTSLAAYEQKQLFFIQFNAFQENITRYEMKVLQLNAQYQSSVSEKNRLMIILSKDQERKEKLEKVLDIIAKKDYDEVLKNIGNYKEQIKIATFKVDEVSKRLNEVKEEKKGYISQFKDSKYEELLNLKKESRALESQINAITFQNQKQAIIAPEDGYVAKILMNTIGGVVTPAEKLISLVPKSAPLIVKVNVMNQDIGFVKKQMKAKIKTDAFSFQKYGYFEGEVNHVGNFSLDDEKLGAIYEVKIEPNGKTIEVEGVQRYLEAGMSVTAEIKVGKRRIIEFFIYPIIRYMDEGLSVR